MTAHHVWYATFRIAKRRISDVISRRRSSLISHTYHSTKSHYKFLRITLNLFQNGDCFYQCIDTVVSLGLHKPLREKKAEDVIDEGRSRNAWRKRVSDDFLAIVYSNPCETGDCYDNVHTFSSWSTIVATSVEETYMCVSVCVCVIH